MKINEDENFWIDVNENKFSKDTYTKKEAIKQFKQLRACTNCINCISCIRCTDCIDCTNCNNCEKCAQSKDCDNCTLDANGNFNKNCYLCEYCDNCNNCKDCKYCSTCEDSKKCWNCDCCKDTERATYCGAVHHGGYIKNISGIDNIYNNSFGFTTLDTNEIPINNNTLKIYLMWLLLKDEKFINSFKEYSTLLKEGEKNV